MHKFTRRAVLGTSAAVAVGLGLGRAFAQSDKSGTLKLQAFGGEAELKSITNAIARFNQEYPNVKVEVSIDPISTGWGDYVTKVFGQFNANSAADVYGTAIETFQAFSSRGLFLPLNDYVEANTGFSDFAPSLFEQASYEGNIYYIPIGWNNIMINYNRDLFDKAGLAYPAAGWT
jgi:multiple sugar transport system substrate-binding protein